MNNTQLDYNINLKLNNEEAYKELNEFRTQLEETKEIASEIKIPCISPIINLYGCSFNFGYDGCAESRYYNGDDVYNPRKEI